MPEPTNTPKISMEAIVQRILSFRQITPIDQRLLKSALLSKDSLSHNDQMHLNRVFDGIRNGLILIVE